MVAKKNKYNTTTKLIAFVKLKENNKKDDIDIRKELLERIPKYMCPIIKVIDVFPMNQNGKCDEKRLMEEY